MSSAETMTMEVVLENETSTKPTSSPSAGTRTETPQFAEAVSVPAVARRLCLTRQFSSPLPAALPIKENRIFGGRVVSDVQIPRFQWSSKEEQFDELEYLTPPDPPDELDRRRALYKLVFCHNFPERLVHQTFTGTTFGILAQTQISIG
jgi:hypothetical protein